MRKERLILDQQLSHLEVEKELMGMLPSWRFTGGLKCWMKSSLGTCYPSTRIPLNPPPLTNWKMTRNWKLNGLGPSIPLLNVAVITAAYQD